MSKGAGHKRSLLKPGKETKAILDRLLNSGGAPELLKRFKKFDDDKDIPYTAGYSVDGSTRFADRDFARALYDPNYAKQIGAPIDTGLSPDDTMECVLWHEAIEKVILDADNPIDLYDAHDEPDGMGAHEYATCAEHLKVIEKGGSPEQYERGLEAILRYCEKKQINSAPKDLACAPYLDDPDADSRRIIARFKQLGVVDASKTPKHAVAYTSHRRGTNQCRVCSMWLGDRNGLLSPCSLVDGLVRRDRTCKKFEPMGKTNAKGDKAGGDLATGNPKPRPSQGGPGSQANGPVGGSQGLQQGSPGRGQANPPE